jgi:hypothetical protein
MVTTARTDWATIFKQALLAGIAGAVLFDAYLWPTNIMPSHSTIFAMWQWVASAVVGPVALTSPTYAWLGMLVHLAVSIGWAGGYAYLTRSQPFLNQRWLISGLFYGFMVYVFMQLVMLGAHVFVFPDNADVVLNSVIAHCVFFGLPVAYVVAKTAPK